MLPLMRMLMMKTCRMIQISIIEQLQNKNTVMKAWTRMMNLSTLLKITSILIQRMKVVSEKENQRKTFMIETKTLKD